MDRRKNLFHRDELSCSDPCSHKTNDTLLLLFIQYGIYLYPRRYIISTLPSLHSNGNHAHVQELHHLQSRSIAGDVLRYMPVRLVLFQGLSKGKLEEAQENLQASQRGAHTSADWRPREATY
jgi:hypothetical protein